MIVMYEFDGSFLIIKSKGEECQEKGNTIAVGKNITWERGSNTIYIILLRLLGRISRGEVDGNLGIKSRFRKMGVGKKIKLTVELYTPLKREEKLYVCPVEEERMFTMKKWNAVAMWRWDVECDTCAICRNTSLQ